MYDIEVTVTRLINGIAYQNPVLDAAMIWVSAAGIPLLVLAGALTGAFAAALLPSLYARGTRVDRFITGIF